MKLKYIFFFFCLVSQLNAETANLKTLEPERLESQVLFQNSPGNVYNIFNLIKTPKGHFMAIIEKRNQSKMEGKHLVYRRSEDGGKTWGNETLLFKKGNDNLVNSAHIIDPQSGRIFVLVNYFRLGYFTTKAELGYDGPNVNRHYLIFSDDDGKSWSEPEEITRGVKPPDATCSIINAGGKGLVLTEGANKGRFILPVWQRKKGSHHKTYVIYSDDRGKTWQRSHLIPKSSETEGSSTEAQVLQRKNGDVYLIARTATGKPFRRQSISKDGGMTWQEMTYSSLPDPKCQSGITRTIIDGKRVAILSHPHSSEKRQAGTLSISFDEGRTWPHRTTIVPDYFGYSCSCMIDEDTLLVCYEADNRQTFIATQIKIKDLLPRD